MFSKITPRIGRTVITGLVLSSIGLGLLGGGAAQARDNSVIIGDGTPCTYGGVSYPEGSQIVVGGVTYVCFYGSWSPVATAFTGAAATSAAQDEPVVQPVKKHKVVSRTATFNRGQ